MGKLGKSLTLDIDPSACITLAVLILFVPLRWIICWLAAAAVHELCHYGMICLTGGRVYHIRICISGVLMRSQMTSWGREVLCAAAGPAGGILLVLLARWMPRLALCALIQSACNLIPVYPLDGGRLVHGLLWLFVPKYAERIMKIVTASMLFIIFAVCVYSLLFMNMGVIPVLLMLGVIARNGKIKIPCKDGRLRVQ